MAGWLAWLTSNCGWIRAIGSSPSNGLKPNLWGQKLFNPLCQCVYVYVCIVNPEIQTIHRCSHTSLHTYIHTYIQNITCLTPNRRFIFIHSFIHLHTYIMYIWFYQLKAIRVTWGAPQCVTCLGHSTCHLAGVIYDPLYCFFLFFIVHCSQTTCHWQLYEAVGPKLSRARDESLNVIHFWGIFWKILICDCFHSVLHITCYQLSHLAVPTHIKCYKY